MEGVYYQEHEHPIRCVCVCEEGDGWVGGWGMEGMKKGGREGERSRACLSI
jgi:hypothetical protein